MSAPGARDYEHHKPKGTHDLVANDFDASGKLNAPAAELRSARVFPSCEAPFDTSGRFRSTARGLSTKRRLTFSHRTIAIVAQAGVNLAVRNQSRCSMNALTS